MGGSNQSLFLIGALLLTQGTAAVPLLIIGLLLSWAALPGWTELIMMWPNRVGGIAATCAEAFRPYNPVLSNLTGVCYWWGWVPTCGLTAILSASAIHEWYLPGLPVKLMAAAIVLFFMWVNLMGIRLVTRLAIPMATAAAALAFLSGIIPVFSGHVDWTQSFTWDLTTPFSGAFGWFTSAFAGLYLIGFAAPAFEAAACHVGETVNATKNVPRAMFAAAGMASVYFLFLPVIWLGVIGPSGIGGDLATTLGPTYAPLFGGLAKSLAIWFMVFNMFHGSLQPLAGASRTLSQLSEDALLPRALAWRNRRDAPWVATALTAVMAILFLLTGDPTWVIAAANLTYLIGIALPSVAVWLLRRNAPDWERPYRAPRGWVNLGLIAAIVWGVATVVGFEQFGLPTVLAGIGLAYCGAGLFAWRRWDDKRRSRTNVQTSSTPRIPRSLHVKLTGAMLGVLALDALGYLLAVSSVDKGHQELVTLLEDIFVAVALLTITVGLVLPGMIAHALEEVTSAANRLTRGTIADLTRAMTALGEGRLDEAHARVDVEPVIVRTNDEVGVMADSFNAMQDEVARAAVSLDQAREGVRQARDELRASNAELSRWSEELEQRVAERGAALERTQAQLLQSQKMEAVGKLAGGIAHDFNNLLTAISGYGELLLLAAHEGTNEEVQQILMAANRAADLTQQLLAFSRQQTLSTQVVDLNDVVGETQLLFERLLSGVTIISHLEPDIGPIKADPASMGQVLLNLALNARDAMPDGGTITITTANVEFDEKVVEMHPGSNPGWYSMLAVTDSGTGMDEATLARCFEPFFTTKAQGEGTGLGLSTVYGVVEQSGGFVTVTSELGTGTTFNVFLPRVEGVVPEVASADAPTADARGTERVLLVEDEQFVRTFAERVLREAGYDVLVAENGDQALELLRAFGRVDLVVTDVMMPGMNGRQLRDALLADQPDLRVLFISGYTGDAISDRGLIDSSMAFLQKPFTVDSLRRKVREVLDAAPKAAGTPA